MSSHVSPSQPFSQCTTGKFCPTSGGLLPRLAQKILPRVFSAFQWRGQDGQKLCGLCLVPYSRTNWVQSSLNLWMSLLHVKKQLKSINTFWYLQGVPKKMGINDLVWFDSNLACLIMINIMVICSCQVFSTHFTCHRAEVEPKLPSHWLTSFWLSSFSLQGHRLYKNFTFYSSFNNDSFLMVLGMNYFKILSKANTLLLLLPQTINLGTLSNHVWISLS